VGEVFFFRRGDAVGEADGEGFFFLTEGVRDGAGDSSLAVETLFLLIEAVADGTGDSPLAGEDSFFGEGVGVSEVFLAVDPLFFFRGLGVGVGVEKIFFRA
jgi:hypothetical protein